MSSSPTYTVVDQFDEDEFPDIPKAPAALLAALNTVTDPRQPRGVLHCLPGILAIAACAVTGPHSLLRALVGCSCKGLGGSRETA